MSVLPLKLVGLLSEPGLLKLTQGVAQDVQIS